MKRFECHAHTMYSNIRLLDCINRPKDLINRAIDLGLSGIAITDHECLSASMEVNKYAKEIKEKYPDFKIALGNEIYLCRNRESGQKYFHFILIAKNKIGHRALRELSSRAWMNSYYDRGMERVVTTYNDLYEIVNKYPNSLIATTACFRKGTKVLTRKGEKNIEELTNKDFILNQYGKWEQINFPTHREYNGLGYEISFLENNISTVCTSNHQFLVTTNNKIKSYRERGKDPFEWVEAKNLNLNRGSSKHICLFPMQTIKYSNEKILYRKDWEYKLLNKEHIRKNKIKDEIEITPEVMRLFGLFLGDGSISINKNNNYYTVSLSFNDEEFPFYWNSFVKKASKDIGISWSKQERIENHKIELSTHWVDCVELFYYLFDNVKAISKHIPERLKNISQELNYELIFGYELADGYFRIHNNHSKNIVSGEMVSASISKELSYGIQRMLNELGIRSSIYSREANIGQDGVNHQESWYVTSSNNAWKQINKKSYIGHQDVISLFTLAIEHCSSKYIEINGVKYKKVYIKDRKEIKLNETVYCLNVDSHSFVCNGVIVHNCLGGELSTLTLNMINAEATNDEYTKKSCHNRIIEFIQFCQRLFDENFYIECAPGGSREQILVNKRLVSIAECFNVKMVIGTDAHYLKKEDRFVHKAYLTSKPGDREVDDFYEYSYLQSEDEIKENMQKSIPYEVERMFKNSMEIYDKIEYYSLEHKQTIPKVEVKDYPKSSWWGVNNPDADDMSCYPVLKSMFTSNDKVERYWVNQCWESLEKIKGNWRDNLDYVARLEEEADIKRTISEKLETNMFSYPVTLQHYVNLFWECGSIVGAGRGSSCSGLNHYLLGITQLDPLQWSLPFWRYLNKERVELGDIDLDLCPSKRPKILREIKKERGQNFNEDIDELSRKNLGCTLIATFGTEGTRSTILTACRGYRSEDYPDGIDVDTAQYMSSLIPSERGFLWPLADVVNGNPDKNRKPIKSFINEVNQYPGLLDIMTAIEGLINKRSSHASGVILFDEDPYEFGCFMKTPKGEIITQYDLKMCELAGMTKYDFLVTEVQDKLAKAIELLQKYGEIDSKLTLREVYNKYFHPSVLPIEDENIWKVLHNNSVLNIFQFDSEVGGQAAKKIKPSTIMEMADANGLMRLMTAEKGQESPMEKYVRFKNNINLWYNEMRAAGLSADEQASLEPYFLKSYGVPPSQEQLMMMLMDENICGFSLAEANAARKIVGKKQMSKIPELKQKVLSKAKSKQLGQYVWTCGIGPQMGYSLKY